jgi:hypothetical protein
MLKNPKTPIFDNILKSTLHYFQFFPYICSPIFKTIELWQI